VNTGEVVAGDPTAGQALVTGDAVNVAARLEQHAAPGGILVGDETHRLVRDVVEAKPLDALALKGKAERVAAWRLLGVLDVPGPILRSLGSPMVGRQRQLAQLRQGLDAVVEDRTCQLVTVFGSAGVGKSRLVEEFLSGLDGGVTVLTGRCLPCGDGITCYPVVESVKQAAGLADFDPPEVVESKVCAVIATDEHQELVCRRVSQLMGIADAGAGEETFWAIRRFYEAVARERPLVLVFDDVQWGEPTFLDLLDHIADWSGGSPMLLVCMAPPRPVGDPAGVGRRQAPRVVRLARSAHAGTDRRLDRELPECASGRRRAGRRDRQPSRGEPAVRRGDDWDADRRRTPRPRGRRVARCRRAVRRHGAAVDPGAAGRSARPPLAGRARRARGRGRDRSGRLRQRGPRVAARGRARARPVGPDEARAQGADPADPHHAPGRGCLPLPAPADPRRGVRRGREVAARRAARAVRGLAGARGRGSRERRGGDRRVPPGAGLFYRRELGPQTPGRMRSVVARRSV
jgi:AAA ATPase domain